MPTRGQYLAQRIGARMGQRGDPMVLRRVSMISGPTPYRNPPDYSADLVVTTGVVDTQTFLGIRGSSAIGRLVAGDQILCSTDPLLPPSVTWTVQTMPTDVMTDSDGVPRAFTNGIPVRGTPTPYIPDSIASGDIWTVIPVTAPGNPDPAASIGLSVAFKFVADVDVFGIAMSVQQQAALRWTQMDRLGLTIAAYNNGPIAPPKVDDQLIVMGQLRSIAAVGPLFRAGSYVSYAVQAV